MDNKELIKGEYKSSYKNFKASTEEKPRIEINNREKISEILKEILAVRNANPFSGIYVQAEGKKRELISSIFPFVDFPEISDDLEFRREKLSNKEEMVLGEMQYGMNQREISERLMLTERSVRRIQNKIMKKKGLSSIHQLFIYSILKQFISEK